MADGTVFILVPGLHTGAWIWTKVAERLRVAGAEAYPLTLSGMTDRGTPDDGGHEADKAGVEAGAELGTGAEAGVDLQTHIADVLRAVERPDARKVVLVGHCYGVHPVVGAADRRPERVARIVLVDTPMPQDGDPAAALVPEQALRERLLRRIATAPAEPGDGTAEVAPPPTGGWRAWGSAEGLDAVGSQELARRAVPQPWGTLAQPLRLSGAAGAAGTVPATGVLCTANGSSLATIEALLAMGDPRFAYLGAPHLSYLEIATGHWPMLSEPDATARVLLRAAAGEGAAARRPSGRGRPPHLRPFLFDVPDRPRERIGRVDLHLPDLPDAQGPHPAVVFVHGGPVPEGTRPTPRDWPAFLGYSRLVAGRGAVGVTVDHRLHDVTDFQRAARDVEEAVALVRAHPRVDAERVALWFFSSGGLLAADWLAAPPDWLRCVAATYPLLAPLPGWGLSGPRFRPAQAVRSAGRLPVVLTRAGRERAEFAVTVEEFLAAARSAGAGVQVVDVPSAEHGFETTDRSQEAQRAVDLAVRAVLSHVSAFRAG